LRELSKEVGHDALHIADIRLLTAADPEILQAATDLQGPPVV
jgi:hypothetical protein